MLQYRGPPASTTEHVSIVRSDGGTLSFSKQSGTWVSDADVHRSLEQLADGWLLTARDGTTEKFSYEDLGYGEGRGYLIRLGDAAGRGQSFGYDTSGRLVTLTGPFGHTLTLTYTPGGLVDTLTDPAGRVTQYGYTGNNVSRVDYPDSTARIYHYEKTSLLATFLTGMTDISDTGVATRYSTYDYDSGGRATLTQHADIGNNGPQEKFGFTYGSVTTINGVTTRTTTVTDAIGKRQTLTFTRILDVWRLTKKQNLTDNKTLTQTFDANNNRTCRKDEENRVMLWAYNATNQKTSMTEGLTGTCPTGTTTSATRTTTYVYLSPTLDLPRFIRRPSVASGQTYETEIVYGDTRFPNLPTQIIQRGFTPQGSPVARTLTLGYNGFGEANLINGPRAPSDPGMNGLDDVTTLEYYECTTGGACGQLKKTTNALGHVTTYDSYYADGRLQQMTEPNGLKTIYTYDARGRVKTMNRQTQAGANAITQYDYTPWGDVARVVDPDGVVLTYTYDAAHYLRRMTDALGNYIEYGYDLKGNRTSEKTYDPAGTLKRSVEQTYDIRNRLASVNRAGDVTQVVFDAIGNLVSETDPNAHTTARQYDSLNRLYKTIGAISGATTDYGFDANDRVSAVTAPGAIQTRFDYDDLGNLLKETSPDRGVTTYTHDAAGNVRTLTNARNQVLTQTYDALNRLIFVDAPATANDTTYGYDTCTNGRGRLCAITNSFDVVDYAYDLRGNVTSHQGVTYDYSPAGRLASMIYPSGAVVHYDRDAAGQVSAVRLTREGQTRSLAASIEYMPFGPLRSLVYGNGTLRARTYDQKYRLRVESSGGKTRFYRKYDRDDNLTYSLTAEGSSYFTYDALNRLDTASVPFFGANDYDHDPNGNRTRLSSAIVTDYAYAPGSNRLASAAGVTATLDATGNLTAAGDWLYSYDEWNRLTAADRSGVPAGVYEYNGLSQRTRKQANGVTTTFDYGLSGELLDESAPGNAREYVYLGNDLLAVLDSAAPDSPLYVHANHLGAPIIMTNTAGTRVWEAYYDPYGSATLYDDPDRDGIKTTLNLRYAGTYYDQETGLHYNWHRYYDPKTGRYISSDPIGLAGGLNTYAYVSNNPLRWIDPTGLAEETPGAPQYPPYTGPPDEPLEPVSPEEWLPPARTLGGAMVLATSLKKAIESGANICKNIRCKIELHGPHHYFGWPLNKKMNHVQLTCWIKGQKGSTFIIRIPYLTPSASGGGGP